MTKFILLNQLISNIIMANIIITVHSPRPDEPNFKAFVAQARFFKLMFGLKLTKVK